jgi:DDE family transposase
MPRSQPLDQWIDQVVNAFPKLSRPQAVVLALYSFGMILAQRCGLNSVVTALIPLLHVGFHTLRSRLQEFYQPAAAKSGRQRDQLDVTTCFAPLLAWILTGWQSTHLALALDATSLGDCLTVLSISVVYRGHAIPVAWKVLRANVPHPWKPEWIALLRVFAGLVQPGWTVIVMTDRALYARWLYQEIVALGWHPVMRITHLSKFRKARSKKSVPVTALVPRVGCRWQGRGVAFPKKPERRLECTLMACWEEGSEEPWFLVTDLDPDQAEGLWYGMRSWIEEGFKLLKRGGWQWQATRMTDPDRVERLWLVLAVATRYVLAVGGEADEAEFAGATIPEPAGPSAPSATGRPLASGARGRARARRRSGASRGAPAREPRRRRTGTKQRLVSIFRQGLAVLMSVLIAGHALPKPSWKPEAWLEVRCEIKASPHQPPTPIPKNPSL